MIRRLALLLSLFVASAAGMQSYGQNEVDYSYDQSGNRTGRTAVGLRQARRAGLPLQGLDSLVHALPENDDAYAYSKHRGLDSIAVSNPDGSISVKYSIRPFDFGEIVHPSAAEKKPLAFSEEEKRIHEEKLVASLSSPRMSVPSASGNISSPGQSYPVGEIPMSMGVSPTGARTYQIPIATASDFGLTPAISIGYNSQGGEGWAGYGWDIYGIPSITLIPRNVYYHGRFRGADSVSDDQVFALDGVPLVTNADYASRGSYPLVTASGNVLASPTYNAQGYVSSFDVLYPDGRRAVFGSGSDPGASSTMLSYPLVLMEDRDGNKMTFEYSHHVLNGDVYPVAIRYGYDSSGMPQGEISFIYSINSDHTTRYYAGKSLAYDHILTGIVTKDSSSEICRYSLTYASEDRVKLLTRVDCSSDGTNLSPLTFEYGRDLPSGSLGRINTLTLSRSFVGSDTDFIYRRGKFVQGSYNDGMLIFPQMETYAAIDSHKPLLKPRTYLFGSPYPADQVILFAPSLTDYNDVDSITAGGGFQTIEAVDVDGDGLDEIVKLNLGGTSGSTSILRVTIYRCSPQGALVQETVFNVNLNGTITSGSFVSPYQREYFWGDFLGNGKAQLLAVAYDKNLMDYSQTSYAALVDLSSHSKLSDLRVFDYTLMGRRRVFACDLDNDGQTELCNATGSGLDVYRLQTSYLFSRERTCSGLTSSVLSSDAYPCHTTDINGDGYIDIMRAPAVGASGYWTRYAFNGTDFVSSSILTASRTAGDEFMFMDINRDGCADLVKVSGTSLGYYMNDTHGSFGAYRSSTSAVTDPKGIVPCNVVDWTGAGSFIMMDGFQVHEYAYDAPSSELRYLKASVDSYGRRTESTYDYLPERSRYWTDRTSQSGLPDGYAYRTLPIYVLSSETGDMPHGGASYRFRNRAYSYYDGVVHATGLGFCGFSRIRTVDILGDSMDVTDETHDPQKRGAVVRVDHRKGLWLQPYLTVENTYDSHTTLYGKLNPRLTGSVRSDALTGIVSSTDYTYDSHDFPVSIITSRHTGSGSFITESRTVTYQHHTDPSLYVLGTVAEETVTREGDGDVSSSWHERAVYTYDTSLRPSTLKNYVGQGMATNLVSEKRWQYDSHGNVVSETVAPYGAEVFTGETFAYDSEGRHLVSRTDALGRVTIYGGYDKFGNPVSVTDHRGRTTSYTYDAWGNMTQVSYPDGTVGVTSLSWGGTGLYTVGHTITGSPSTLTHVDALGREIRSGEERFDGQWQWTDRSYDARGRLYRESLPYRGSATVYWNTYSYDVYDRPDCFTEASGKVTTWSYAGASVTTVKEGVTSTRTADASGNIVSTSDPGGMVTYNLRDDGQPSSVIAPGGAVTFFAYDVFGRRTQMSDPSAGTRTDTYELNNDGTSVATHITPTGSVVTRKDQYGRVTSVEREGEFDTGYTYDTYGLLVSEQSTNGTGRQYTYDSLDRIATVREFVPGGKWLEKIYAYGSDGQVSGISYLSQDGPIATELYSYANGHEVGIALPRGTVVWNLVSEDDLGLPTEMITGTTSREYGYTAFGLPSYRKIAQGDTQYFTYQFDVATGNLLSRGDSVRGMCEEFGYDHLNRLISMDGRRVSYGDNGDILSIGDVGDLIYSDVSHPYRTTSLATSGGGLVPSRGQSVAYTCYDRPSVLSEGERTASFIYNGDGERVIMSVTDGSASLLTRYYLGGRYEYDQTPEGSVERLYLGGDAYSAPMVYVKEEGGSWTAYNIGRDYLGSITHIAALDGTLVAEYSYDPWGRLRDPETLEVFTYGNEPELFLGRGFTGHEHLTWFGLINMNARLYDPLIGRFLSPDPYVQAPDFTQSFNRYSYALNNPLKYTDESGELLGIDDAVIIGALIVAGVSMAIDYGIQVFSNYIESKNNPDLTPEDIWFNKIDWFDIGISGIIGGITGGYGTAAESGHVISKFGAFLLKHTKLVKAGEILLTSAVDITGEGVQDVTFKQFSQRFVTGIVNMEISDQLSKTLSKNNSLVEENVLPEQTHHFATNKNKVYTPKMQEIASKYGLDLDGDWNKALMRHLGRHPNEYHDFVLQTMYLIDSEAAGDTQKFLNLFDIYINDSLKI
ncbi:MAG: AHH domain-containing protein [Bacteroidales bacterium]|nr:AHH domain-containing protein [Bacteroidales bacterium]